MKSGISEITNNQRALGSIAGLLAVALASLLAVAAIEPIIVVPLAVVAAFAAGVASTPKTSEAERAETQRQSGETLLRQVRSGRKVSILDPQTALLQRWYFELRVAEEARRCRRYATSMALIFIKVQAAQEPERPWTQDDEIDFVQMFARTLRSVDLAARINEGEYAVCLPQTSAEGAAVAVARLLEDTGGYAVSAFMAHCPGDGMDYESLAERAQPFAPEEQHEDEPDSVSTGLTLLSLVESSASGEVAVPEGQNVRNTKAKLRRAAKRAGVDLRIWDDDGVVRFERLEPIRREGAA